MPEPAMLKTLKSAMVSLPYRSPLLAARDGGGELAEAVVEESERRLEAHGVLRELALLHLRVDGVAVERGGEGNAVSQELLRRDTAGSGFGGGAGRGAAGGDVARAGGHRRERAAAIGSRGRERRPEVDVACQITRSVGVREVGGEHLRPL